MLYASFISHVIIVSVPGTAFRVILIILISIPATMFSRIWMRNEVYIEFKLNNYDGNGDGRIVMTLYRRRGGDEER